MRGGSRRGAALFVVLAFSALLASLAGAALRTGVSGARAAAAFADAERADELGRAAGDIVGYRLSSTDPDAPRGGRLSVRLADAEIAVDYLSESARIDVNAAPVPLITALLAAAGADQPVIDDVAARIVSLRRQSGAPAEPVSSPAGQAQTLGAGDKPPVTAAQLPSTTQQSGPPAVQSTLDLVRAWNLPDDIARRVLPSLTVANGSKQVDPVIAGRMVLLALLGGDETRADDYLTRRAQGFVDTGSALALLPVPSQAYAGFTDVPAVRAVATVTIAKRIERRYEMVVVPTLGSGQGPAVVSWQKLP